MSNPGNPEKAKRYLSLLDAARCEGRWSEVPELARKVGKHAPWRHCLVLTARAESEVALSTTQRPSTASSFPNRSSRPALLNAIENDQSHAEDVYQAKICLAAGYLSTGEKESAIAILPLAIPSVDNSAGDQKMELQGWTYVCSVKAAFLADLCRGSSNMPERSSREVLRVLRPIPEHVARSNEYSFWTEKMLLRLCNFHSRNIEQGGGQTRNVEEDLEPFREWASFFEGRPGKGLVPTHNTGPEFDPKIREVWWSYYKLLSQLLREGYVYPVANDQDSTTSTRLSSSPRLTQSSELRRVEATYESLLLKEVAFPEASQINTEIDDWVDQLMANWSITCGSSWQDDDLGAGGQETASRNVLDILYRAATRSFHSNSILRHLLVVHASLGEFELAGKALDSYLEIVSKSKERAEKSGQPEPGLDSDESMLQTVSTGIDMLCRFGRRKEAIRAEELASYLEKWMHTHIPDNQDDPEEVDGNGLAHSTPIISPHFIAQAHKAIAISKANWAHFTLQSSERADLQKNAISRLRKALMTDLANEDDPSTLYALSAVLAETRDIDGAIATIKYALSSQSSIATQSARGHAELRSRQTRSLAKVGLVQCWHLLALLLSARQDFEKAEASCEAAVEVFDEYDKLPGELDLKQLSVLDKKRIVEAKMTAIALSNINDGPAVAVNGAGELLSLYSKIFGTEHQLVVRPQKQQDPPKTATGHRSIRESIFGRHHKDPKTTNRESAVADSVHTRRLSADTTRPPTIAINDDDYTQETNNSNRVSRKPSHRLQKRPSQKSVGRSRTSSPARTASVKRTTPSVKNGVSQHRRRASSASQPYEVGLALSDDMPETMSPPRLPPLKGVDSVTPEHAATPSPDNSATAKRQLFEMISPKFSVPIQERYASTLLSQIWIFISGLYRKANMIDDARSAIDEALHLAAKIEAFAAVGESSSRSFQLTGRGGAQSANEVYADAYAELGQLYMDQNSPYEAMNNFELAVSYFADHPSAVVGLSTVLLDIYTKTIALRPNEPTPASQYLDAVLQPTESSLPTLSKINPSGDEPHSKEDGTTEAFPSSESSGEREPPILKKNIEPKSGSRTAPEALDRLWARDRAYGLLSTLTKLGTSWDNSEAWFALARAYEESGQPGKAQDLLWWVVELEEKRPVRSWRCLGQGYSV